MKKIYRLFLMLCFNILCSFTLLSQESELGEACIPTNSFSFETHCFYMGEYVFSEFTNMDSLMTSEIHVSEGVLPEYCYPVMTVGSFVFSYPQITVTNGWENHYGVSTYMMGNSTIYLYNRTVVENETPVFSYDYVPPVEYLSLPWGVGGIQEELFFIFGELEEYCIKTFLGTVSLIETEISEYENLYVVKSECSFDAGVVYRFYFEDNIFLPVFSIEVEEQDSRFVCSMYEFQRKFSPLFYSQNSQSNSCFVFPNPASSILEVSCEASQELLDCYSVSGRYICSMRETLIGSNQYDVSFLVPGVYIITTQSAYVFFVKQ